MKRRTFRKLRQPAIETNKKRVPAARDHHNVYVTELDPAAAMLPAAQKQNPRCDPQKPCVYVGMTGLTVEQRFANHKAGVRLPAWSGATVSGCSPNSSRTSTPCLTRPRR
jgi:hypothetical protein